MAKAKPDVTQVNLHLDAETVKLLDAIRDKQEFKPARQTIAKAMFAKAVRAMAAELGISLDGAEVAKPKPVKLPSGAPKPVKLPAAPKAPKSATAEKIAKGVAKLAKPVKEKRGAALAKQAARAQEVPADVAPATA
jgi:hypothetical protein